MISSCVTTNQLIDRKLDMDGCLRSRRLGVYGAGNTSEQQPSKPKNPQVVFWNPKSRIFLSCLTVIVLLLITLPLYGYFSYTVLYTNEHGKFSALFDTLVDDIFAEMSAATARIENGAAHLANYVGTELHYLDQWPNATLTHYELINSDVGALSEGVKFALAPIVRPDEVASFEEFAMELFDSLPYVPPDSGESDFGFGIFAVNSSSGERYHDTLGVHNHSEYDFLTPLLYSAFPERTRAFLLNLHSIPSRARGIDKISTL